ncbi:MAG: DUF3466 family protein [Candidatus Auribacterota bacterium]|jgi:probable HAF family extracellular repeat protein|nr:DUF3466 family protein [Candidatus Auribacterota bacterium]
MRSIELYPLYGFCAVSAILLLFAPDTRASGEYEIYDVTPPYSNYTHAYAFDLNEDDQVVGKISDSVSTDDFSSSSAFIYSAGIWTNLDVPPKGLDGAYGINESQEVAGYGIPSDAWDFHAYRYDHISMTTTDIGNLENNYEFGVAVASDINDSGAIVGYSIAPSGYPHAFKYESATMIDLSVGSVYYSGYTSVANAINNNGVVVGSISPISANPPAYAFMWTEAGKMVRLDNLGLGIYSEAHDINDLGYIVGFTKDTNGKSHAFLCLGALGAKVVLDELPSGTWSEAYGINNNMQIVGSSDNQAVLWEKNSLGEYEALNLNDFLPEGSLWTLVAAYSINDKGSIVGWGTIQGESGFRAFLLQANYDGVPIPEPLSILLLLGSIVGIIFKNRLQSDNIK